MSPLAKELQHIGSVTEGNIELTAVIEYSTQNGQRMTMDCMEPFLLKSQWAAPLEKDLKRVESLTKGNVELEGDLRLLVAMIEDQDREDRSMFSKGEMGDLMEL